jgi:hypothetical protein
MVNSKAVMADTVSNREVTEAANQADTASKAVMEVVVVTIPVVSSLVRRKSHRLAQIHS